MIRVYIVFSLMVLCSFGSFAQNKAERTHQIDSSVITANKIGSSRIGNFTVSPELTGRIVTSIGENDILQAIFLRPGTAVGIEGSTGYFIRGSASGGNRIELSGAPIYRASHLLGLVSALPSEMISSMTFAANGLSASSGNFSSSLTQINLKNTIAKKFSASASVSPFMESLFAELPAGKSFTARISARVSPALLIADKIIEKHAKNGSSFKISDIGGKAYDLMATMIWHPFEFVSLDAMAFSTEDGVHYSYQHGKQDVLSRERLFKIGAELDFKEYGKLSATYHYSASKANHIEDQKNSTKQLLSSYGINNEDRDSGGKIQYSLGIADIVHLTIGGERTYRELGYDTFKLMSDSDSDSSLSYDGDFLLLSGFGEIAVGWEGIFTISASARPTTYKKGMRKDKATDIHAFAKFNPIKAIGIEASYDKNYQYFHVLEGLPSGWSQDMMFASDLKFPKETLKQLCVGLSGDKTVDGIQFGYSIGYFDRKMDGLTSFKHVSHVFGLHDKIDKEEIVSGRGWSHGLEFYLEARTKVFGASLSYTYSVAKRHFDELNSGNDFKYRFDKPHILNVSGDYLLKKSSAGKAKIEQRTLAGVYLYSGNIMTANKGFYPTFRPGIPVFIPNDNYLIEDLSVLNNFRLPAYFRIDAGYSYSKTWDRYGYELTASVFNLLNKHNAYQYFYSDGSWKQLSILPIMPTVKFKFKF